MTGAPGERRSHLVGELVAALRGEGWDAVGVGPGARQARRVAAAAAVHALVVADGSALDRAVPAAADLGDPRRLRSAAAAHSRCDLSLLYRAPPTADGAGQAFEASLRATLDDHGIAYAVVGGPAAALASLRHALRPSTAADATARWHLCCERCSDPDCEARSLRPRGRPEAAGRAH